MCFDEKPLSGSAKDVEDIIRCCDEAGVVFMEAFAYLHSPIIQEIKKTVQSGAIGKVTMAEAAFFIVPPKPEDIRWKKETLGGRRLRRGMLSYQPLFESVRGGA